MRNIDIVDSVTLKVKRIKKHLSNNNFIGILGEKFDLINLIRDISKK